MAFGSEESDIEIQLLCTLSYSESDSKRKQACLVSRRPQRLWALKAKLPTDPKLKPTYKQVN